jgi:hypothetical protein
VTIVHRPPSSLAVHRIVNPIRIEPAFEDRERVRSLIDRHAPYGAIAAYVPDGVVEETRRRQSQGTVWPWFRGNWATGGRPLVEGAASPFMKRPPFARMAAAVPAARARAAPVLRRTRRTKRSVRTLSMGRDIVR